MGNSVFESSAAITQIDRTNKTQSVFTFAIQCVEPTHKSESAPKDHFVQSLESNVESTRTKKSFIKSIRRSDALFIKTRGGQFAAKS
jgi:chitinase